MVRLWSENNKDRSFALEKIIQLRNDSESGNLFRRRRTIPSIKLEAVAVRELKDWKDKIYEPVFTCKVDLDELEEICHHPI